MATGIPNNQSWLQVFFSERPRLLRVVLKDRTEAKRKEKKRKQRVKWTFLVSLKTQVLMLFCWGRQVEEHFAEANTDESMFC